MTLRLLYRGPLASCNYACHYCPFAKQVDSRAELEADRAALARFVAWVGDQSRPLAILFTPWGEALTRRWYREAIVALSQLSHVRRVAIQTNLAARPTWLLEAKPGAVGIWATFHPDWTTVEAFAGRVRWLHERDVRVSAGAVGLRAHVAQIEALRLALPDDVYLWVNAAKSSQDYGAADIEQLSRIDPLFALNTVRHPSQGLPCEAGQRSLSIAGDGTVRRCHFVAEPLGNLYQQPLEALLAAEPQPCPQATCGCHIGAVNLPHLGLGAAFGSGLIDRIPDRPWRELTLPARR